MTCELSSFQLLMQSIDKDCVKSKKKRLYYSISTNQKTESNIIARSVIRPSNTPALSFLIRTFVSKDEYTLTYLSQIDIIEILSKIDKTKRVELWGYLSKLYRDELELKNTVVIQRAPINNEQDYTVFSTASNVVAIPALNKEDVTATSFGFNINYYDFCECLSLMLSMEPNEKLKMVLSKYLILSDLISDKAVGASYPDIFANANDASDLESIYDDIADTIDGRELYDFENFGNARYEAYFRKVD